MTERIPMVNGVPPPGAAMVNGVRSSGPTSPTRSEYTGISEDTSSQGTAASAPPRRHIHIEVGGEYFVATLETLSRSGFLLRLLSSTDPHHSSPSVDGDATLFASILGYLRNGTYPLFVDDSGRHDILKYLALLAEARYFEIPRLVDWLQNGCYAGAVSVEDTVLTRVLPDPNSIFSSVENPTVAEPGGKITSTVSVRYYPAWGKMLVYACPRGISVHQGAPDSCGRRCRNALVDSGPQRDEVPTLRLCEVRRTQVIDPSLCVDPEW